MYVHREEQKLRVSENGITENIWNKEGGSNGRNEKIKNLESSVSAYVIQSVFLIMFLRVAAVMVVYHIGSLGLLGI
jgi:hypothetical protein